MNSYEERKLARIERYKELATNKQQEATDRHEASSKATEHIPFGQPILVGHHSEGRHRRDLKRSWDAMGKSVEAQKKAEYYADKAKAAENNTAISSDDPDALDKLKVKLARLQERHETYKAHNVKARKEGKEALEGWMLSNSNANIKNVKERIKRLEEAQDQPYKKYEISGVEVIEDPEINRLQIFFDCKPPEEMRTKLKRWGFIWAPSIEAWQRQLNNQARYAVQAVLKTEECTYEEYEREAKTCTYET